jgi:hypothetical protein
MAPRDPKPLDWSLLGIILVSIAILALAAHLFPGMFS